MNWSIQRNVLLYLFISVIAFAAVMTVCILLVRKQSAAEPAHQRQETLPEDVESVLKGYSYTETSEGLQIDISGNQIIRRGKKILGLRSNLVKTNFFEDLRGTVAGPRGTMIFSASDAEWDADATHPLLLKKNVSVEANGRKFHNIKNARIFFKQGTIEVNADRKQVYKFKE